MIIQNALIYTKEHQFQKKDLFIRGGRIEDRGDSPVFSDDEVIDGEGLYAIPGLVDIHFHAAVGRDFCDADLKGLQKIGVYEASRGVLAMCPATMTFPEEKLSKVMQTAAMYHEDKGADLVGIHMEGPFLSPQKLGAQNPEYVMRPDAQMFRRLQKLSGNLIKIVDIAPEVEGAMEFIEACADEVNLSIAHTVCDYETACAALAKGVKHMTHLFNAMPGIAHREPGPIIAAQESGAEVEVIADGIHVHPAMLRFIFRTFPEEKICLVSDSMEATGLGNGTYRLGGMDVIVQGRKAVLSEHPQTIAGSVTNLFDCMKYAVLEAGIPLEMAVRAATENPAKAIGIQQEYGQLSAGFYGNVVLFDRMLNLKMVLKKGTVIWRE